MGIDKMLPENIRRQVFCTGDIAYAVWCTAEALEGSHHLPFSRGVKESNLFSYFELSSGYKPKRRASTIAVGLHEWFMNAIRAPLR
jgi:hypothetical protein